MGVSGLQGKSPPYSAQNNLTVGEELQRSQETLVSWGDPKAMASHPVTRTEHPCKWPGA